MEACNTKGPWFETCYLKLNFLCQLPPSFPFWAEQFWLKSQDVQVIVATIKSKLYTVKALLWMDFSNLGDVNFFILVAGDRVNLSKICQCPLKPLILSWAVLIHDIGVIVITIKPIYCKRSIMVGLFKSCRCRCCCTCCRRLCEPKQNMTMPLKAPHFELSRFDSRCPSNCRYNWTTTSLNSIREV